MLLLKILSILAGLFAIGISLYSLYDELKSTEDKTEKREIIRVFFFDPLAEFTFGTTFLGIIFIVAGIFIF